MTSPEFCTEILILFYFQIIFRPSLIVSQQKIQFSGELKECRDVYYISID